MIGRLMLSLKKAADTRRVGWEVTTMTYTPNTEGGTSKRGHSIRFAPALGEGATFSTEGDLPLAAAIPSLTVRGYA